jgi:dsDNA-specific endonuclease/ATPase MutS2
LVKLRAVLDGATPRTLVLLDEGFVGTDPTVGVAMARATLENLAAREATVLVTTHFSGLKALAEGDGRFQNGSMEFEPRQLKPTYRLRNGIPGQSYALELATRLGFPESILEAARSYVGEEMMRVERLVADLSRQKEELESQLEEQSRMSTAMGAELAALESDRKALGHARDTMVEGFREKLRKRLNAFENRLEIRERQFEKAKRDALRDMEERVEEPRPPVAKETTQPAEAHSASKAPRAPAAPSRTAPKSSPPSAAPSAAPSTAPAVRVTLTGFDALKGVTLSNARGKGSSASGSPATRVSPTDELVARARRPDKLTPRDLLDEARASLGRLEKSFDGIEERFHDDIDALGDLEDEAESARATGKTARERLKAREKEEAAKMGASGHPATFWRPGMRVRTQRLRDAGEVLRAVDAKGLVECKFGLVKMKLPHADLFTVEDVAKGLMAKGGSAKGSLPARPAPARALPPTKGAAPHREGGGSAGNRDMGIEPTFQHKGNTLDVRGQLVDSALEKVEAFLDRALREGQSTIIIIHGHGTGRVKQGVRELLQETRFELAWRPGTAGEGSDGVTVVKLA